MGVQVSIGAELAGSSGAEERVDRVVEGLVEDRVASRVFAQDPTVWIAEAREEAAVRLGWTDIADRAAELIPQVETLRAEFASAGVDRIVLCGMGGSSLAPAVITRWAGVDLTMIDSTHPSAVARVLDASLLPRTAVVVSSKSGGTIETRSHLAAFEAAFEGAGIDPATRIVIVTDPGSPLEADSLAAGRRVFLADPDVGGRFSALTAFGIVPSVLAGADLRRLVAEASAVRDLLSRDEASNPALRLAAAISDGLPERFVLAVVSAPDADWGLGSWIEQLIAESTGKGGVGVLPIALPVEAPEFDRVPDNTVPVIVADETIVGTGVDAPPLGISVAGTLGGQMLLWETATAVLGRLMEIDPFNQPDVEAAKVAARAALAASPASARADASGSAAAGETFSVLAAPDGVTPIENASDVVRAVSESLPEGGYVAIQAYLDPAGAGADELRELRAALAERLGAPVALGFGPSYLHSVGQLHKGGPALGVFLQLSDAGADDVPIPDSESFGTLITAQALGDRDVLTERGRPVIALRSERGRAGTIAGALLDAL